MNKYLVITIHNFFLPTVVEQLATKEDAEIFIGVMSRKNPEKKYRIAVIQD